MFLQYFFDIINLIVFTIVNLIKIFVKETLYEKNLLSLSNELINAISNNQIKKVKLLIENNADVNTTDNNGIAVLLIAVDKGYKDIITLLIENNVNINVTDNNGDTALTIACYKEYKEIVKFLLDNEANIDIKDNYGNNILNLAILNCDAKTFNYLIENFNFTNKKYYSTISSSEMIKNFIKVLIDEENQDHPMSDETIAKKLIAHEIQIA